MTAHVKLRSIANPNTDWQGENIGAVGDRVRLVVELWNYANLDGGKFRVKHAALDPAGHEVKVPKRKGTGARSGVRRKRRAKPEDLSRTEMIECEVPLARACDAQEAFTLEAVTNCQTVANAAVTLRGYATREELERAKIVVPRWTRPTAPLLVTRGGATGPTARIGNTVQAPVRLYVQFFFKDPEGNERPMPENMPVKVLLGDTPAGAVEATLEAGGRLALDAIGYTDVQAGKVLTVRFGASTDNRVICEAPGATRSQTRGPEPAETDPTGTRDKRFFTLPRRWTLRETDWTVTNDDDRWVTDKGQFKMLRGGRPASLGTASSPVKMVLDPHWQFLRFDFFDRVYGRSDHAKKRKSVPPMVILGRRVKTATTTEGSYDVESNWWLVEDGETVQCVPWILQKTKQGVADKRPSRASLLRFKFPAKTHIKSESATVRTRVIATTEELKHGPDRLKFYDLPTDWQSRNYFAKLSDTTGEFGWYEDVCEKPTAKDKPLVFCLDDTVLTDKDRRRLDDWSQDDRLAIFTNTFDETDGCTREGVFDPDTADKKAWYTKLPATGAVEANENYVIRQPLWTRAIAAHGSLFDVFDQRTVVSDPEDPDYDVVGARAAVRWVDTTDRLGTTEMWEPDPLRPTTHISKTTDHKPAPGRFFRGAGVPAMSDHGSMVIQPYYGQHYTPRGGKFTDAADKSGLIGRFDMALLRSCGVETVSGNPTEVAVNLHFLRTCFDFADAPPGGAEDFARDYQRNILDRWNGISPDVKRAKLVPQETTKRLQVTVVDFMQVVPVEQAHFKITVKNGDDARDWRNPHGLGMTSGKGKADAGGTSGFASAHEHGHESGLPDEYNERWDGASYGQLSFKQHLPGDPYELDGRSVEFQEANSPMMNGNSSLHNRYFWPSAEWVRRAVAFPVQVKLNTRDAYKVPPHTNPDRTFAFWPLAATNDYVLPAVAPLTANHGKTNLFLYAIGADDFAMKTLPEKEDPAGTTANDGVLMLTIQLRVNAWSMVDSDMKLLVQAMARVGKAGIGRKLSHKWYLTGAHGGGSAQEWTFQRCAMVFSPRFVVSTAPELPTRVEWGAVLGSFKTQGVAVTKLGQLDNYHAVPWSNASGKSAQINTVKGAVAAPTTAVRGTWDADSVITGEARPPAFGNLDTTIGTYEAVGAEKWLDSYNAARAVADAARAWATDVANVSSPYLGAAQGLAARAGTRRDESAAMFYVRQLEAQATALASNRTKHEQVVNNLTTEHGVHFTVNCMKGTPASASWDTLPVSGDLPAAGAWLNSVHAGSRGLPCVTGAHTKLSTYKGAAELDLAARITALKALEGPEAAPVIGSPRGDWDVASVIVGKRRPSRVATLDGLLGVVEAADATDFSARFNAYLGALRQAEVVENATGIDVDFKTVATQLKTRLLADMPTLLGMHFVRSLEVHARTMREHLERVVTSRTLTITANSVGAFESELLKAFPSMVGVYKSAASVTADDLKPLLVPLGLTGADIHAI